LVDELQNREEKEKTGPLQNSLFENDSQVTQLQALAARREKQINQLQSTLRARQQELSTIHTTLSWKLVTICQKTIDKFLPNSTRRRRAYDLMVNFLKYRFRADSK
jgi:hypothetical protein